jgi:carbonic anhydrase/acetyltransferase-like protein (isoleucine patch superfamily)
MNYLFGWNSIAEFILDELKDLGVGIQGVVIDDSYINNISLPTGIRVIASSKVVYRGDDSVINCLGYRDLHQRILIGEYLRELGVLTSFVSKKASVHSSTHVGLGTVLVGDVVIERGCDIGRHSLFWGGSRVCHDSAIGQGVFLASGVIIGGGSKVGQACSFGFNSSMREKSSIPAGAKVGANSFWRPGGENVLCAE